MPAAQPVSAPWITRSQRGEEVLPRCAHRGWPLVDSSGSGSRLHRPSRPPDSRGGTPQTNTVRQPHQGGRLTGPRALDGALGSASPPQGPAQRERPRTVYGICAVGRAHSSLPPGARSTSSRPRTIVASNAWWPPSAPRRDAADAPSATSPRLGGSRGRPAARRGCGRSGAVLSGGPARGASAGRPRSKTPPFER